MFKKKGIAVDPVGVESEDRLMSSMRASSLLNEVTKAKAYGLLDEAELRQAGLNICEQNSGHALLVYKAGLLTIEEAKVYALRYLDREPQEVFNMYAEGLVTRDEARVYALKVCQL